jgi:hypothetical protein
MRVRSTRPAQRIAGVYVVRLDAVSLIAAMGFFDALLIH